MTFEAPLYIVVAGAAVGLTAGLLSRFCRKLFEIETAPAGIGVLVGGVVAVLLLTGAVADVWEQVFVSVVMIGGFFVIKILTKILPL